ncbi:tripartite tricarboxylate transporter TctB family protein [Microbaculum marinum]|uniref:Tripartite tricarboxylate transporter TctB family protein n=1 Tax=Microbaculum marinum TaxID=1764581 RepID=A0AAW9RR17_9HYPH
MTTDIVTKRIIRSPKDAYGGLALMLLAAVAWWGSLDLAGSQGTQFGPGTAPRLFAGLLFATGFAVMIMGLCKDGEKIERYGIRGPLLIGASVVLFAAAVGSFGLPVTAFFTILVASAASHETRWIEAIVWAAFLSIGCTLLFVFALGLSLPLWPDF